MIKLILCLSFPKDIDECARGTHECLDGARCDNLPGSFHCTRIVPCGTGYTINGVTQQCVGKNRK